LPRHSKTKTEKPTKIDSALEKQLDRNDSAGDGMSLQPSLDEAPTPLFTARPRYDQTFPVLTATEIGRIRRFGGIRRFKHGEQMIQTGTAHPGMFVLLSGNVAITQRDGLGNVTPRVEYSVGHFVAEIGQLSGRVALVDGHAEGDVEALLIPAERLRALLVAEADLGERIMRALILRRVNLIQGGVGGPTMIGSSTSSGMVRLQGFLTRNGLPHHLLDPADDKDAADIVARYAPSAQELPLVVTPDGTVLRNPTVSELARAIGMLDHIVRGKLYDVAIIGSGPGGLSTGCMPHPRGSRSPCAMRARLAVRPVQARGSKIIWAFRQGYQAWR
jgi:thioredoxin reductase (NADPH)